MAIDDNTSYELTGYQVKDLAQKIRAKADSASLASVATSGLYSDLTGAPTIPSVYNGTLTIQQNGTTLGTFSANQSTDTTINLTGGGATYSDFTGATSSAAGTHGLVPAPAAGDGTKYLKGDGTWGTVSQYTPTVFYIDNSLPRWDYPSFVDVHIYKDPALTDAASLQELYDAIDAGGATLVYDASISLETYGFLYAFHSPRNGNPDSVGDYMYFANDNTSVGGTVLFAVPQVQSTNDAAILTVSVAGLYAVGVMNGATSSSAGMVGLVPAPAAGDQGKVLHGDGTWKDTTAKLVEMNYGESKAWAKFLAAYNAGSIVYCRASSNSNPATGSQTRKAFMAYVNNATTPTEVEFQYVRSMSSKTDSQQCDQVFVYKLTNASGGTWTVQTRNMAPKIVAGTGMSSTFTTGANATITIGANTMTGATSGAAGAAGIVPAPAAGSQNKFLRGDGTWAAAGGGGGRTTLYTDHSLGIYSVGDTIAIYKDKALTQQITTLAELGSIFDSSVVVLEDNSKESWLFFYWYDDDAYNWSGPGYFWVRSSGGEEYGLCWDRYDGNVLKLYSTNSQQSTRSYSTSEAYTGENWIDGKSIYRKTISFGALPNATTKSVAHNITGLSEVVKIEGIAKSSSGNYTSVPVVPGNANALCDCSVNTTDVIMSAGSDRSGWSAYVTIYYTKS